MRSAIVFSSSKARFRTIGRPISSRSSAHSSAGAMPLKDSSDDGTDYVKLEVFSEKSLSELARSWFILKSSSIEVFVKYSDKLFLVGRRYIYPPVFKKLMTSTFYGHFTVGSTINEAKANVKNLTETGIRAMLCVPTESVNTSDEAEALVCYERNRNAIEESILGAAAVESGGFAQMKLTPLCDKQLLLDMNAHLLEHQTNHEEPEDWDVKRVALLLEQRKYEDIKMQDLPDGANKRLQELLKTMDELAAVCESKGVRMMIDAEQTYIQASLGWLVLVLQAKYNKNHPLVYNTYQCYRKDMLACVKADKALGDKHKFCIAGKLVRGAYMAEERRLAKENGCTDPINDTYEDTGKMYHSIVDYLLPYVAVGSTGVMIASHNEQTVDYVKSRVTDYGIALNNPLLCFGQLYGMCDHVSLHLGQAGYQIYKSVPYGALENTLLYLSRRAAENKSVLERTRFERFLIRKELNKRFVKKVSSSFASGNS